MFLDLGYFKVYFIGKRSVEKCIFPKKFFPSKVNTCNMKLALEHPYFELCKIELNSRVNYLSSRNKKLQWIYSRNEFVVKFGCKNIE